MSNPAVPDWNLFHLILQDKHRLAQTLNQWEARFLPLSTNEKLGYISYQPMTSWFELEDRRTEGLTDGRTYKPCTKPAFRQAITYSNFSQMTESKIVDKVHLKFWSLSDFCLVLQIITRGPFPSVPCSIFASLRVIVWYQLEVMVNWKRIECKNLLIKL